KMTREKMGNIFVWLLIIGFFVFGTPGIIERFSTGHQATSYGSYIPWGLWISAYIWLIGLSAGALMISVMTYVFGVEEGQPRVVCDFKGTEAGKNLPENITVNGKYIHNIHISNESSPQKIRVILNLASNMSFDLQQVFFKKENLFVLIINPQGKITPREQLKIPGK
ncbi:MAG: hypothetical protein DSY58_03155, partial [Desulfobulbus sp.]